VTHKNKKAIVTGSAKGIGCAIAKRLAMEGAIVAICDIDHDLAIKTAKGFEAEGLNAEAFETDVSSVSSLKQMTESVASKFGGIDILVNNAGILESKTISELDEETWDKVIDVNLKSVFFASQAAIPYLYKSTSPRIVNISSMAGRMGGYEAGLSYSASKGGIITLTMGLARRLACNAITVNCICPGPTRSDILNDWTIEQLDGMRAKIPVGRIGEPVDIAAAAAFLTSDEAGFITGMIMDINGGCFMG